MSIKRIIIAHINAFLRLLIANTTKPPTQPTKPTPNHQQLTATIIVLLQFGAAGKVHFGGTRADSGELARAHPVLDLLGHGDKGLFDVDGVLGGRLQKGNIQRVGVFLVICY